jgi:hypothetical protein
MGNRSSNTAANVTTQIAIIRVLSRIPAHPLRESLRVERIFINFGNKYRISCTKYATKDG